MLHEGFLSVVDVVSEAAFQWIVYLSILIQFVYNQFMHYVHVERGRSLQAQNAIRVLQGPNDGLIGSCRDAMCHAIRW